MLSIEKCREILGDEAVNIQDEELIELRRQLYNMVELIFDDWLNGKIIKKKE